MLGRACVLNRNFLVHGSSLGWMPAVCFLTRTFRNVFCVRVGKRNVCLWRSQRSRTVVWGGSRKLEEAFWRQIHAHCRRWRWGCGHAPGTQTEPQLEAATSEGVILPETGHSCCYARYSCGNECNVVVKVQVFCRILRYHSNETVCRERCFS